MSHPLWTQACPERKPSRLGAGVPDEPVDVGARRGEPGVARHPLAGSRAGDGSPVHAHLGGPTARTIP